MPRDNLPDNMHLTAVLVAAALSSGSPQVVSSQESAAVLQQGDLFQLVDSEGNVVHQSAQAIEEVRRIEAGGTQILVWQEGGLELASVQLAGREFQAPRILDRSLHLLHGAFDPQHQTPALANSPLNAVAPAEGWGVHIVQLDTPSLADVRAELEATGAEILRFLPSNAHIVAMDASAAAELEELDSVRWVGPYHAEYRLEHQLLQGVLTGELPTQRYLIQTFRSDLADKQRVASRIEAFGGQPGEVYSEGMFLDAVLTSEQLGRVAGLDEVLWIDPHGEAQTYMDRVRVDGGANFLEGATGFSGEGVAGEVLDSGFLVTHPDFQTNPPLIHSGNSGNNSHGTAVAGIVFGDGTNLASARGLLPDGQMIASSFAALGNRYTHTQELLQPPFNAVFQTNSWGFGTTTQYNNWSTQIDDILFQYDDIVILQAQANTGGNSSDGFAWGKNVVSVGGIRHFNTQTLNDDAWNNAGSIGPAADGRIKPDMSYWYDSIQTTANNGGYTNSFGGTSAATPEAAGHFGLFFQMWHENVFGNNPTGATVFESRPKATLARAFMLNGVDQYAFQGGMDDLKRLHQGWGRPDVQRLYELRDRLFYVEESEVLQELDSVTYDLEVPAGEPELRATMVYLDPAGTTSASLHRINDVTLKATSPSGVTYWGNRGMRTNMFTQPDGTPSEKDPVEQVWIENPEAGVWSFEVIASEITQDAHLETAGVDDVDFSLVVSGVLVDNCGTPAVVCDSTANSTGQQALLDSSGSVSIAANDLVWNASSLPANQPGVLFYGPSTISNPFGNGTLCVGGPYARLNISAADGSGNASWDLDVTSPPNNFSQITAGSTWTFQVWYRDPVAGGSNFNLSQAREALFCN